MSPPKQRAPGPASGAVPDAADVAAFREVVLDFYAAQGRTLPWRETRDPYAILVSEIMLQQTQVDRVREKYREFLGEFPTLEALAAAELSRVLTVWQGLGYNRRAVALKNCAQAAVEQLGGKLPADIARLESLPGIGPYTARAVAAFAFDIPSAFIETNIRSVFILHFFPGAESVHDRELLPLVEAALVRERPREWYYALMDYGAMLKKTRVNPSRQSAHHVRQSPFRGSNRERRSLILRSILASPGITQKDLVRALPEQEESLAGNLERLEREGFIRRERGGFVIC
ncbi:endonuclease III [Geomonas silvestris]|uniref:Adenine DNA glycosylase n=1 Tax=Geomonas silvestris TaxID=2740184 RepID=A0A6V8MJI8_9BACT|nr:A/G-specific adenine glycosylase [Geomonas silvestris]GFO60126.1 endonuclease III [Geomonas silvestris]